MSIESDIKSLKAKIAAKEHELESAENKKEESERAVKKLTGDLEGLKSELAAAERALK